LGAVVISSNISGSDGEFVFDFEPIPITFDFAITSENNTTPLAQFSDSEVAEGAPIAVPDVPARASAATSSISTAVLTSVTSFRSGTGTSSTVVKATALSESETTSRTLETEVSSNPPAQ
jgi:hypothetical protein